MRTPRDTSGAERLSFRPELSQCPECDAPLHRRNISWRKTIQRMDGLFFVVSWAYCCTNASCLLSETRFRSVKAEMLSLKWRTFGMDVIVEIGFRRVLRHETVAEIHKAIRATGMAISEREVYELLEVFYALIELRQPVDDAYLAEVKRNGGIVLAIDGVKPEWSNETLYILMDAMTGRVLYTAKLCSSATDDLTPLLEKVKAMGLPALAIVSDHQQSIRLAVAKVFPGVPHQLCHFHVLRNASQKVVDLDRNLKKCLKSKVRGMRKVERSISLRRTSDKIEDGRLHLVTEACEILRAMLKHDVAYPLKPGGLLFFDMLKEFEATLQRCLEQAPDTELARLQRIAGRWRAFEAEAERVRMLYGFVWRLAHILNSEYPSYQARMQLGRCLADTEKAMIETSDDIVRECLNEYVKTIRSHWWGLFHCYDDERIPRTNNGLEGLIGSKKQAFRRTTGRRHWGRYVLRFGRGIFMGHGLEDIKEFQRVLEGMDPMSSEFVRQRLSYNRAQGRRLSRIRGSFKETMESFEEAWAAVC